MPALNRSASLLADEAVGTRSSPDRVSSDVDRLGRRSTADKVRSSSRRCTVDHLEDLEARIHGWRLTTQRTRPGFDAYPEPTPVPQRDVARRPELPARAGRRPSGLRDRRRVQDGQPDLPRSGTARRHGCTSSATSGPTLLGDRARGAARRGTPAGDLLTPPQQRPVPLRAALDVLVGPMLHVGAFHADAFSVVNDGRH